LLRLRLERRAAAIGKLRLVLVQAISHLILTMLDVAAKLLDVIAACETALRSGKPPI
jgi:hypothetical protein